MSAINQATSLKFLPNPWMRALRIAWVILAVLAAGVFIASIPGYLLRLPNAPHGSALVAEPPNLRIGMHLAGVIASMSAALLSMALAWVLFRQKLNERMVVFLSFYLLVFGISSGPLGALFSLYPNAEPLILKFMEGILFGPMTIALLILFPNGRLVPSWTRWIVLASLPLIPVSLVIEDLFSATFSSTLIWVGIVWSFAVFYFALYAQIYRYRKTSSLPERQQTKWFVFGIALWLLFIMISTVPYIKIQSLLPGSPLPWWISVGQLIWYSSTTIIPISLTIAVWRYRLYDIDIIINRTLVYGVLTASTMGIYVVFVGLLGNLFQGQSGSFIAFLTTGLVAVLFQPLRNRLQGMVNHMMYGERDNPISILSKLGKQMERTTSPHDALWGIVETIAQTLKLPYAAIEFEKNDRLNVIASFGQPLKETVRFPIIYQTENIGSLVVSPRFPNEPFSDIDNSLLENVAGQTGAVAQAARLTEDLLRSRQNLVTAREEERRRIRRDLHDGLGPTLASQGLKIAAVSQLLTIDPEKAQKILEELASQNETSVAAIRRLVYGLRPAALDELGLISAIRDYATELDQGAYKTVLVVDIDTPNEDLPTLSAAIEVAAYRIATEALTNVSRHSRANKCIVSFKVTSKLGRQTLHLEITDDGSGLVADRKTGVGLTSMRERAEEIGGSFRINSNPGQGTQVVAHLPLSE